MRRIQEPFFEPDANDAELTGLIANVRPIGSKRFEFSASFSPVKATGFLLDSKPNKNRWFVDISEYPSLVRQIRSGISTRFDHGDLTTHCIGKSLDADIQGDRIKVLLEIGDENIATKVARKYVSGLSLRGSAEQTLCEICDRPVKHEGRDFVCEVHGTVNAKLRGVRLKEISIVSDPAWNIAHVETVSA